MTKDAKTLMRDYERKMGDPEAIKNVLTTDKPADLEEMMDYMEQYETPEVTLRRAYGRGPSAGTTATRLSAHSGRNIRKKAGASREEEKEVMRSSRSVASSPRTARRTWWSPSKKSQEAAEKRREGALIIACSLQLLARQNSREL